MKVLSNLIIELYRAAQEMAVDEFQEFSIGLLKSLVQFDSAIYGNGALMQQGIQIQEVYLHNKPLEQLSDYAAITHFFEAIKINQALAIHRSVGDADCSTVAISRQSGGLNYCSSGFRKLLNIEWPAWESAILPSPLMDELNRVGSTGYCSANIRVSIKCVGNLLFLKASKAHTIEPYLAIHPELLQRTYGLSAAEARVAIAMLDGGSAKELAIYLKVSPHTVRTQVRNIYAKYGVNSRPRFVKLMHELSKRST